MDIVEEKAIYHFLSEGKISIKLLLRMKRTVVHTGMLQL